jgi:hypothetical protein
MQLTSPQGVASNSDAHRIQTLHSLLTSGISHLLADGTCTFLNILSDIHRGGLYLLGLALDLMAFVPGEVAEGGFKLAFCIFGSGINFV